MDSIWTKTTQIPERPPLAGAIDVQAAVIGAGMAGILTARLLKQKGIDTVVLEADRIGSGQTKNTTAKVTAQHGMIYEKLLREAGEKKAKQYADSNMQAIADYRDMIRVNGWECGWEELPAYLYALPGQDGTQEDTQLLRREAEAACQLGLPCTFLDKAQLPYETAGAVRMTGQACFHPLEFLKKAAEDVTVYEQTKVKKVDKGHIVTDKGVVNADSVIFACHFPFVNVPGYYFLRMHQERSYVLALSDAVRLDGMYYGISEDSYSYRNALDLLLIGGCNHRTGENEKGGRYERLRQAADGYWPGSSTAAQWSAQDCMTLDSIPYIGHFAPTQPNWYVATGFGKWGMTHSMVAARLISELIVTGKEEAAGYEVFAPHRFDLASCAQNLAENGKEAVKGLTRSLLSVFEASDFPEAEQALADLPAGRGMVVEHEGRKAGAFKENDGHLYLVSLKCPHLGCELTFNADENSWDCPCHGSRFDYKGKLLDNPAQNDEEADGIG